jgi:hypothetical chaperone protein
MARSFGLDFGTTNTVLAKAQADGSVSSILFPFENQQSETLRTALCFSKPANPLTRNHVDIAAGSHAIQRFIDDPWESRFLQSIKTFAASAIFTGTNIFSKQYQFEDLMEAFLACAKTYAGAQLETLAERVVVGRPVTFAGATPNESLAMQRYEAALRRFGFREILYVYEPLAAAFFFALTITKPTTVLVADFGGGTTDFSIVKLDHADGRLQAEPLAHGGIGIAGDHFDYRIIDHVLLPRLGKGSSYTSMGKTLMLPRSPFQSFARWNMLSLLKTSKEFRELKHLLRYCKELDKIQSFIDLVEDNQGYPLYKAVSEAKMRLSSDKSTTLKFPPLGSEFEVTITRHDFETWIAPDLHKIETTLDGTLRKSGVAEKDIERVFLTGGTSFIPAVRHLFTKRFGASRVESGSEFVSIAQGLALIAARDDAAQWTVGTK